MSIWVSLLVVGGTGCCETDEFKLSSERVGLSGGVLMKSVLRRFSGSGNVLVPGAETIAS